LLQDHIELRIIPGSNGLVNADPVQVEQVILNLAINAGCLMELGLAHTVVGANEPPLEVANGAIGKGTADFAPFPVAARASRSLCGLRRSAWRLAAEPTLETTSNSCSFASSAALRWVGS
jgi:hypothetical protein